MRAYRDQGTGYESRARVCTVFVVDPRAHAYPYALSSPHRDPYGIGGNGCNGTGSDSPCLPIGGTRSLPMVRGTFARKHKVMSPAPASPRVPLSLLGARVGEVSTSRASACHLVTV